MSYDDDDFIVHAWPIVSRGGQHVGVQSGILIVHRTTGVGFVSDEERSQMKNRAAALAGLQRWLGIDLALVAARAELSRLEQQHAEATTALIGARLERDALVARAEAAESERDSLLFSRDREYVERLEMVADAAKRWAKFGRDDNDDERDLIVAVRNLLAKETP